MNETIQQKVERLEAENVSLRRVIEIQKKQMKGFNTNEETRRLREKIAEWEGTSTCINGGYYHGSRFIRPYQDNPDL
jgi:hypothetical protein